jgi:hypothetical protein
MHRAAASARWTGREGRCLRLALNGFAVGTVAQPALPPLVGTVS